MYFCSKLTTWHLLSLLYGSIHAFDCTIWEKADKVMQILDHKKCWRQALPRAWLPTSIFTLQFDQIFTVILTVSSAVRNFIHTFKVWENKHWWQGLQLWGRNNQRQGRWEQYLEGISKFLCLFQACTLSSTQGLILWQRHFSGIDWLHPAFQLKVSSLNLHHESSLIYCPVYVRHALLDFLSVIVQSFMPERDCQAGGVCFGFSVLNWGIAE